MALIVTQMINNLLPLLHAPALNQLIWWTDAELTRWVADALKRHAMTDGTFVLRHTQSLFAGQADYAAPPRHLDTIHVAVNGQPLVASSTTELEALDDAFRTTLETTGRLTSRWYADRIGANRIGVYPVPAVGLSDGGDLEIIYHGFPCNLDEAHTDTRIEIPDGVGEMIELAVLGEAYACESDAEMPEVAQSARSVAGLIEQVVHTYWGRAQ